MSLVVNAPFLKFYTILKPRDHSTQLYIVPVCLKDPLWFKLWQKNIHTTNKK